MEGVTPAEGGGCYRRGEPSNDGSTRKTHHPLPPAMSLWEISLRARYDHPFIQLSAKYPETPISMWCVWNRELLQVPTREPTTLDGIERGIRAAGRVVDEWVDSRTGRTFLLECTCGHYESIWTIAEENECIESPPSVFQDRWGYFRILSLDDRRTRDVFRDLTGRGTTELLKKRELPLSALPTSIWVQSLFADLTGRQTDSILAAHRSGYYSSPRRTTTEILSRGAGVSRSTFEEHLRKAENRVLDAVLPYLRMYADSEPSPEVMPTPGPPGPPAGPAPVVGAARRGSAG